MTRKGELREALTALGVEFRSRDTVADLEALLAAAEADAEAATAAAAEASDLSTIRVSCPRPGLSLPLTPYFVRVKAAKGAEGRHDVARDDARADRDDETFGRRVGAPIDDDGYVTEPGAQKRIVFDDDGYAEVEVAAWEAFTRNGEHVSWGIRVA